ncbi:unnamed protein product, partial [Closterium sp. NIES-53]
MAAQELCWLTYLLTELGEQPRSPPVLYVDNKAMIALCQEHRLEHRTKHIPLRHFLARELQQRGQLCLAYMATRANTADVFTKALPPGNHQRFVTMVSACTQVFHSSFILVRYFDSNGSGGGSWGFGGGGSGSGGGAGGGGGGSGSGGGSGGGRGGVAQRGGYGGDQRQQQQRPSKTPTPKQLQFGDEAERPRWLEMLRSGVDIFALDYDAILAAMYALYVCADGDCYLCVPPDPGIEDVPLGASEFALPGTAPAEALHTFTLDSGASRCFFRDSTTLTPLPAPVPVRLADPSGGPVPARSSTVLPCPAVLSGSLSGLHLPSFSTNLVAASAQVSASGPVAPPCSCRLLSHQTLLWHHRLGHPSLPRLRGMHSRLLVSGLPRSLPPLPPSPAPPCLPCVEGRQRAAPHSSSFPPTTAPLQTLHMDV